MSNVLHHEFNGLIFGKKEGEDYAYGLVSADGLDDLELTNGQLDQGGADGRGVAPMWAESGGWVTELEVYDETPELWAERRDLLKAATSVVLDRTAEYPYDLHYYEEPVRTRFCRVSRRLIPTNEQYLVDQNINALIGFTANDPHTYGPEVETTLSIAEDLAIDSPGWALSERWSWTVTGPVVNPRLTLSVTGEPDRIVRFDGAVATGETLVVDSTPHRLLCQLEGVDVYGVFDGGPGVPLPGFFKIPPGDSTVLYSASSGSGSSVFVWRTAYI